MTLEAHDDDIHPRGEGEHYLENYLFTGLSDDSDFGFYLHVSRMFEVGLYELHVATYHGDDVVTCLERHDLDEGSMTTDTFSYEIIEPMREWRLVYSGSGHSGAFVAGPEQPLRDLRMDIRFRAELPPADLHAAFLNAGFGGVGGEHYEQGFVWEGDITVGDTTVHERGLGLRDHSWGKRHMVVHNTTWWFPAVAPGARLFYTGLEINRSDKQLAAATRTDESSSQLLDHLKVTVTAGDQVTYSRAELTWGDEPPATAQGVCRIPMPWLIGQGLPRLSDDLFCRVELPDGSRGFGVVEMSRAATEAEQAGFRATIDTRASTRREAAAAATGLTRDLAPRIRGLAKEFPVDWSEFYTRTLPGHVQRTVLASMLVDLDEAAAIDRATLTAYRAVLAGYRAPLLAAQRLDLVTELDAVMRRNADAAEASSLVTRIMAALPMHAGPGDELLEKLHRAAVDVDVDADRAWTAACRRHFADPVASETDGEGADESARVVSSIDTAIEEHFGLAPGTARGQVTAGGLSKVTLTYELPDQAVVVRADRGARYSGALVVDEYRTIAAAHAAGVPAPAPVAFVDAVAERHPAFSIVERVPGSPLPGIPRYRDAGLCRQLAQVLATVHRTPVDTVTHVHGHDQPTVVRVLADLAIREKEWRGAGCANPLTEFTFQWLRTHAHDADGPRVLVHGDYRPHNMLGVDRSVSAVLDWEHAKVGNAAEDLAYVRPAAEALASWEEFLDTYVAAGGRAPTEPELRFYEVSGSLFNTTILDQMELEFAADESQPLTMLATVLQARPVMRERMAERMGITPPSTTTARQ